MQDQILVESKTMRQQVIERAMNSPRFNGQLPTINNKLLDDLVDLQQLKGLVKKTTTIMLLRKDVDNYKQTINRYNQELQRSMQLYVTKIDNLALAAIQSHLILNDYLSLFCGDGFVLEKTLGDAIEQHLELLLASDQTKITEYKREVGADFRITGQSSVLIELKRNKIQKNDILQAVKYATEIQCDHCVVIGKHPSDVVINYANKHKISLFYYYVKDILPITLIINQLCGDYMPILGELQTIKFIPPDIDIEAFMGMRLC